MSEREHEEPVCNGVLVNGVLKHGAELRWCREHGLVDVPCPVHRLCDCDGEHREETWCREAGSEVPMVAIGNGEPCERLHEAFLPLACPVCGAIPEAGEGE